MISLKKVVKKLSVSFCVSAGILSIANVESIWREEAHRGDYANVRREAREDLKSRLITPKTAPRAAAATAKDLRDSLAVAELGDANPFARLSDLRPLNAVLLKGITSFKRQAYRSPNYKEESGYDLVAYQITHPDHTNSLVLAYLERTLEGPDLVPVVLIVSNGPEQARQAVFRAGDLTEDRSVPLSVALSTVNQRVNAGVPFFSVAR